MPTLRPSRLRSPLARAVVPVLAGIGFFVLLGLATYGVAAVISDDVGDADGRLAPTTFRVGSVETFSRVIAEEGPIIFPDLIRSSGGRAVVLYHAGTDPATGWQVFFDHPLDRDPTCSVEQVEQTTSFTDCDGREIDVADLAPANGVVPIVENRTTLIIDLRQAVAT